MLTDLPIPYDLTPIQHSVLINSVLNVKALVGAFNQEKALPRRVLLHDCEIFTNLQIACKHLSVQFWPLDTGPG